VAKPATNTSARLRAIRTMLAVHDETKLGEVKSDINITPLVDVVLVLLIIFMVVTPMIASGVAVDLPRTENHSRKPDDGNDIIVSVTRDKEVYVGSSRINRVEDLPRAVSEERRKNPNKTVFLKGDSRSPYGYVRRAMQALQKAGIDDVVLGTEEATRSKPTATE
jgi:biopolymer transport protein ExbD/biopolymer transport protein TolR